MSLPTIDEMVEEIMSRDDESTKVLRMLNSNLAACYLGSNDYSQPVHLTYPHGFTASIQAKKKTKKKDTKR